MNLAAARDLKRYVVERVASPLRRRVAVGISVTDAPGRYRVAILLHSHHDRRVFETRAMRALFRDAGADLEVEVIGELVRTSGGGHLADNDAPLRCPWA